MATTKEDVIEALKLVIDPELFIDIYTLGLVYNIDVNDGLVAIRMTFTSVACPAGPQLVEEVKAKVRTLPDIDDVQVEIVFRPPWQPSEELKALMGIG